MHELRTRATECGQAIFITANHTGSIFCPTAQSGRGRYVVKKPLAAGGDGSCANAGLPVIQKLEMVKLRARMHDNGGTFAKFEITFFELPLPGGGMVNASVWPSREGGLRYAVYLDDQVIQEGVSETVEMAQEACWAVVASDTYQ